MLSVDFSFNGFNSKLIEELALLIKEKVNQIEFSSFSIGFSFPAMLSEEEKKNIRKEFQFPLTKKLESLLSVKAVFDGSQELEILINFRNQRIYFQPKNIFIKGSYLKFKRGLPQTKYYCFKCKGRGCNFCKHKGVLAEESVEELIAKHALPLFKAEKMLFHGAGREDTDVLMLGNGRPFIIELIKPLKRSINLNFLQKKINENEKEKIKVLNLEFSSKAEINKIKHAMHSKIYEAIVCCEKKINVALLESLKGKKLGIEQRTPLRVLKRRTDKKRKHEIELISFELLSEKELKIKIKSTAGCYIKEFISSDNNRTKPSLSSLLNNSCNCKQLDVIEILE